LDGWQRVAYLQQIFWSRWKEEYLTLLQQRSKWRTPKPGLVVDDLVLVKDENLPPMKWPLARAIELLFGGDGVARVAVLKTASGVTKRAVSKLCLLPLKGTFSLFWIKKSIFFFAKIESHIFVEYVCERIFRYDE